VTSPARLQEIQARVIRVNRVLTGWTVKGSGIEDLNGLLHDVEEPGCELLEMRMTLPAHLLHKIRT